LSLVCFSGGEPTLLGEDLLDAIAYVDGQGILSRIVTNAHWASTPENADAYVRKLLESGLNELNVSTDDYHLPYVPFSYVENAWNAAKGQGFGAVVIANANGPESKITPNYIMEQFGDMPLRYDKLMGTSTQGRTPSADGTVYLLSNPWVHRVGRASDNNLESNMHFPEDQDHLASCCRMALVNPALSPNNHLLTCCGLEGEGNEILDIGDMGSEDIETIYARANDNVLINAIIKLGPLAIKKYLALKAPELQFPDSYASMCEICQSIVKNPQAVSVLKQNYFDLTKYIVQVEEAELKAV